MSEKTYKIINNIIFTVFILLTAYIFFDVYIINKVPTGSCPLTDKRPLIYLTISLGVISFVFSFLKKKLVGEEDQN